MDDEELDEFHAHEAMDRASMLCNIISGELLSHPYIQAHGEIHAKVEQVVSLLADVYQQIGRQRFSGEDLSAASLNKEKQG